MPYFGPEFRDAVQKLPSQIIRFTWNNSVIRKYHAPQIEFDDVVVDFPDGAFLQPTTDTEKTLRDVYPEEAAYYGTKLVRIAECVDFVQAGLDTRNAHADGYFVRGVDECNEFIA